MITESNKKEIGSPHTNQIESLLRSFGAAPRRRCRTRSARVKRNLILLINMQTPPRDYLLPSLRQTISQPITAQRPPTAPLHWPNQRGGTRRGESEVSNTTDKKSAALSFLKLFTNVRGNSNLKRKLVSRFVLIFRVLLFYERYGVTFEYYVLISYFVC